MKKFVLSQQFSICCLIALFIFAFLSTTISKPNAKGETLQTVPLGVYDLQKSTIGNVEYFQTNYGC